MRARPSRLLLLVPLLGWLPALLIAAPPATSPAEDSYSASAPAADQGTASRDQALRESLRTVLIRVSGVEDAALTPLLARASSMVQHYGFEQDGSGQLMLNAAFDPDSVNTALRGQGLPVFGVHAAAVEEVAIDVDGIASAADYSRVLAHLRQLPGSKGLWLDELANGTARFRLRFEGGQGRLAGALSVGGVLLAENSDGGNRYRLNH